MCTLCATFASKLSSMLRTLLCCLCCCYCHPSRNQHNSSSDESSFDNTSTTSSSSFNNMQRNLISEYSTYRQETDYIDEITSNIYVKNYIENSKLHTVEPFSTLPECFICFELMKHTDLIMQLRCCKAKCHEHCFDEWCDKSLTKLSGDKDSKHEYIDCPHCSSRLFDFDYYI